MEDEQRKKIGELFPKEYLKKRIISLDIPDIYDFNDEKLKKELIDKVKRYY
ncbi:hypothetical protein GF345_03760 [Candidatus Woesearchaeota archaeon]|nr:hypothetical protein [Candidatus Woesearchaeota archaeon]